MAELKRCPECGGVATVIHMYLRHSSDMVFPAIFQNIIFVPDIFASRAPLKVFRSIVLVDSILMVYLSFILSSRQKRGSYDSVH